MVMDEEILIKRTKRKDNFTIINNKILQNKEMSFAAKGLLCYILSLPDDWILYNSKIMDDFSVGRDRLRRWFKEIEKSGYLCRIDRIRGEDGRYAGLAYLFYEESILGLNPRPEKQPVEPRPEKPPTGFPPTGKQHLQRTNILNTNNTNTQKEIFSLEAPSSKKETWAESFAVFWATYPKKKAKGDAERAWKKIPHELIESVLNATKTLKEKWVGRHTQYCPYPASWLNAKGWEDEDLTPTTQETKEEERKRKEREFLARL